MKVTVIPIVIGALGTISKGLIKGLEEFYIERTSRGHPNYRIVMINLNTEKSPGGLIDSNSSEIPSVNTGVKTRKEQNNSDDKISFNKICIIFSKNTATTTTAIIIIIIVLIIIVIIICTCIHSHTRTHTHTHIYILYVVVSLKKFKRRYMKSIILNANNLLTVGWLVGWLV